MATFSSVKIRPFSGQHGRHNNPQLGEGLPPPLPSSFPQQSTGQVSSPYEHQQQQQPQGYGQPVPQQGAAGLQPQQLQQLQQGPLNPPNPPIAPGPPAVNPPAGGQGMPFGNNFHAIPVSEAMAALRASMAGLTRQEVEERIGRYGYNRITPGASRTIFHIIWDQLCNVITGILAGAAVIAGIFGEWIELGFIVGVITANVIIGVIQEGKAEAATKAISQMVTSMAMALRNSRKTSMPATELVPGDIVFLLAGDRVPADLRLVETNSLRVIESALTGESTGVTKYTEPVAPDAPLGDRTCMAFMGSLVTNGDGIGLVVATGDKAEIGRINALMSRIKPGSTPLQQQVAHFGILVSVLCVVVAIITFLVAFLARGDDAEDALRFSVGVAVALIPEGLPTVVTITLALGVQVMAKHNAIVRQLPAVETLGAVTCICTDKTGTLTRNEMTVVRIQTAGKALAVSGSGYQPQGDLRLASTTQRSLEPDEVMALRWLLLPAALCNDATLMPVISAEAQRLIQSQALALPYLESGSEKRARPTPSASRKPMGTASIPSESRKRITATGDVAYSSIEWCITGDPMEAALLSVVMKSGLNMRTLELLWKRAPRIAVLPFTSENKFMATVHELPDPNRGGRLRRILYVKGAVDVLLPRCVTQAKALDPNESEPVNPEFWNKSNLEFAQQGMRVLAICQYVFPEDDEPEEHNHGSGGGGLGGGGSGGGGGGVTGESGGTPSNPLHEGSSDTAGGGGSGAGGGSIVGGGEVGVGVGSSEITPAPSALPQGQTKDEHQKDVGIPSSGKEEEVVVEDESSDGTNLTSNLILGGRPKLQLNGLIAIVDPPREEAIRAIESCHTAGIIVKMITGDHADTARTIGSWIGIKTREVITGVELSRMSDEELATKVEGCNIYARANPEHKLRIVRALQSHKHIVSMTGDGVNDAPALRQANVGVAMGIAGTEVAKEAARIILQDDNFATLETAVRLGRCVYDNLRKLVMFILPTSIAQGLSVAIAVFINEPSPLTTVQILYVNMITSSTLGIVLAAEKPEPHIMERLPRESGKQLVGKLILWRCFFVGGSMIAAMLGQVAWTRAADGGDSVDTTTPINTLVFAQCLYCLSCRFLRRPSFTWSAITGNRWLLAMVLLNIGLQFLITYTPGVQDVFDTESIGIIKWLRILMFAFAIFALVELEKLFGWRFFEWVRAKCCKGRRQQQGPQLPSSVIPAEPERGVVTEHEREEEVRRREGVTEQGRKMSDFTVEFGRRRLQQQQQQQQQQQITSHPEVLVMEEARV